MKSARKTKRAKKVAVESYIVPTASLPVETVSEETVQPAESLPAVEIVREDKKHFSRLHFIIGVLMLLLLSAIAAGWYFYTKSQPTQTSQNQAQNLIAQVGKLIELPSETPTIATVSDVQKLSGEQFFQNAKDGDKVLIYPNAKKAYLYDPTENKLVNVGPLTVQAPTPTLISSISPTKAVQVNVALYNGTTTSGLASKVESQLKASEPHVKVVSKGNAITQDYTQTLVVDISGNNSTMAQALATELKGKIGPLPQGEQAPSGADILVILGSSNVVK